LIFIICSLIFALYKLGQNIRVLTILVVLAILIIIYIILNREKFEIKKVTPTKIHLRIIDISFLLLFIISLYLLFDTLYIRPLSYFIIISIIFALIALEVILTNRVYLTLLKIVLVSINLRIGLLLKFPAIGGDTPYWIGVTRIGKLSGDVLGIRISGDYVSDYPMSIINSIIHVLVLNIDSSFAVITAIALPLCIIVPLFVYIIGSKCFNEKIGIIGALLIVPYTFDIWYVYQLAPMSFAVIFIPILIYAYMQLNTSKKYFRYLILFFITFIMIIFSHPLVMVISAIIIICMYIGDKFYSSNNRKSSITPIIIIILLIFVKWVYWSFTHWMDTFTNGIKGIIDSTISLLFNEKVSVMTSYTGLSSTNDQVLISLGFALFIGLAFLGILYSFRCKKNIYWAQILPPTIVIAIIAISTSTFALMEVPYRWLGILGYLLSIFLALGILRISINKIFIVSIVFLLVFLMMTNPISNMDSPIYGKTDTTMWAFTTQETNAAQWSFQYTGVPLIIDGTYTAYFRELPYIYGNDVTFYKIGDNENKGLFVVRNYMFNRSFYGNSSTIFPEGNNADLIVLNDKDILTINELAFITDRVYDNDDVKCYYTDNLLNNMNNIENRNID
jgi:hypothetical protein